MTESKAAPQLPLMNIDHGAFEAWSKGDLNRAEEALTKEVQRSPDPSRHSQALAQRALIRSRLKQHDLAVEDAKKSLEVQRSTIGQVAIAIARAISDEPDAAIRLFDLVFRTGPSSETDLLLLIKAVILFECGKHEEAILRVGDLINVADDKPTYIAIQAQMRLLLADTFLSKGNYERAAELLGHAKEAAPPAKKCNGIATAKITKTSTVRTTTKGPQLLVISLIFGCQWDTGGLPLAIQTRLLQCARALEDLGDAAMHFNCPEDAAARYTTILSLNSPNLTSILVKRSKARAMTMSWDDALKDADAAIKADPRNPWGYERRYVALDALQRYDDAVDTLNCILFLVEEILDPDSHCRHYSGDAAFGQLLEDIMAHLGEEKVLAWTGKSSSYNSCIPADFSVCRQTYPASRTIEGAEMDARVAALRTSVSPSDALLIHSLVTHLPPTRLANRRLFLPCIAFQVKKLVETEPESGGEKSYRARVSGIGRVEFKTSDELSLTEPRKLVLVYPWLLDLRASPPDDSGWESASDSDEPMEKSDPDGETEASSRIVILEAVPDAVATDDYTRTLQLIVRLQQPFRALLLQQQPDGEYRRIAAEHEIIVAGLERCIDFAKDIRTEVLDVR